MKDVATNHKHKYQNVSTAWVHCYGCDTWKERERVPLAKRDLNQEITEMDWQLKNELQWRTIFTALKQYRDKLSEDLKQDRIPHLDEYIEELKIARKH